MNYKSGLQHVAHGKGRQTISERLNRKRYAADKTRRERKRLLDRWPVRFTYEMVAVKHPIEEPVLDGLNPQRSTTWKPVFERPHAAAELDLKNFSFVDDPINAISLLKQIAELESKISEGRLNFDDQPCLDIGPFLVLQEMNKGMLPIFLGGRISGSVLRVIEFVGLRHALGMRFSRAPSAGGIWPLPFRSRTPQGASPQRLLRHQTSEHVATEVIERINEWLAEQAEVQLTEDGERLVLSMTGEVLDNAERHSDLSSRDGSWSVAGFMVRQRNETSIFYKCHLALLSTGASIAESMATAGDATKARMDEYVRRHRGFLKSNFTDENLQTVFALQDGVSRVHDALAQGRGGTGFMDIIEFFAALSGTSKADIPPPSLAIISGSTCISIKPPYMVGVRNNLFAKEGLRAPRELWFNPTNNPDEMPDPAHVLSLPARLKGTLITMVWTTDPEYLQSRAIANAENQSS
ncbi:MAG TPA: hypothetical protein VFA53_00075 [Xanthobacteraceae bacterium]|nr:hypothetical protein [Xanthobacteraceae bacterium]